ncbi:MAG: ATP-binding cassette domain-containing protein [Planctomycetes bacterium]|nr:ATP-binding cassette domain-containing protein [Planctomycetota bacterium]MBL7186806.1 ATP-binding cassette domain-containing protein [Phycisphaerae bacterium]
MATAAVTVRNISKSFGKIQAVRDLSFSVDAGSCYGLLGPNGAGKTTAMKMIYGKCTRDKNCEGLMDIFGYDPAKNELAIKYFSGVVQQENNLDDELNVIQNLMIYSRFYDMPAKAAKERIEYLLDFLDAELAEQVGDEELSNLIRVDHALNAVRYYCDDMEVLKNLAASQLEAGNYLIRQTNLEDVFLRATGRHLNDKQ